MREINFVQIGFGPIGEQIARLALDRNNLQLKAVVDIDKKKTGKDIAEILKTPKTGIKITPDLDKILKEVDFDIAVVSTLSSFKEIFSTIKKCVENSKNVISTCEELLYPWANNKKLACELDEIAKLHGVTVLGTGVNPGCLMDFLPVILTTVQEKLDKIVVKRFQDASKRRLPFQKKIGAGLDVKTFNELVEKGIIKHVGFKESVFLIAKALNINLDDYKEVVNPVIAKEKISSEYITVKSGDVKGIHQVAYGFYNKKEIIKLELKAFLGNPQEEDTVEIYGIPNIKSTIKGGVNGDIATAAVVINTMPNVIKSPPGLKTVIDIPPAHYWR